MSTAVLRRYTPPTCTLEVAAARSVLSRWTARTALKDLRFQLNFDDPKLMPDQQVTVSGDQVQLEALSEAVGNYVQQLIGSPAAAISWEPSLRLDQTVRLSPDSRPDLLPDLPPDLPPDLLLDSRPDSPPDHRPVSSPSPAAPASVKPSASAGIILQPQGLLSHELRLGSLANAESGPAVRLSTLQLFDLANALEAYHAESIHLPVVQSAGQSRWGRGWPTAAAALLALGVTGAMAKFVLDISRPTLQTASAPNERQANTELNRELFPTLAPPPVSPSVTLQPLPPPPTAATPANGFGLPPIGRTQPPPATAAPQAGVPGPASGAASGSGATLGQPQVTVLPGAGEVSVPNDEIAASQADEAPPRLVAGADAAGSAESAPQAVPSAPQSASRAAPSNSNSTTAFDTIPQVAEVRNYFQQRWQPPSGLSQTLEYRLLLNADGSLQRIVPLGQFSENYLDRTNMPLMGEPFVSATRSGETPQIRLVLKPDGKVQSFLEYAN